MSSGWGWAAGGGRSDFVQLVREKLTGNASRQARWAETVPVGHLEGRTGTTLKSWEGSWQSFSLERGGIT